MELKPGYKQSEVGPIPEEWAVAALDSVAKRGSGHTPSKKHPEYWDGEIKWVSLKDSAALDVLYIADTAETITSAGLANSSAVLHPSGTVVLSRDAGVGKSAIMKAAMAVSQHFMAWRCGTELNNHFLYYWLQSQKPEFERVAIGNTIKTIGLAYFRALKIPLPSPNEQCAIAQALADDDALLATLAQLIAKKRDLKQAAMQQLLTGQRRLPGFSGEWEVKCIKDIAPLQRGFDLPTAHIRQGQFPVVYSNGVSNHHSRFMVKGPGVVTGRSGTIGNVHFVNEDFWPHNTALWVTSFKGNDPKFVFYLYQIIGLERLGTGSGVPTLNRNDVHGCRMPIPPSHKEEAAIAAVLSDMDDELAALGARLAKTRALKQGMMQELLTGRTRLV